MKGQALPSSAHHDPSTEGLRGLAALMVIYTHMLTPYPHVDPGYAVSAFFWNIETSQGAVLLFFVLSGYVIGLTNSTPLTSPRLADYARRRAMRLVPLYWIAVLLGSIAHPVDSFGTIIGNLFFLQNHLPYGTFHIPPIEGNVNLWSLNYEVLYYLLFPLIWICPRRWPIFLAIAALSGVVGWKAPLGGALIASYAAGWTFWLAGYALAQSRSVSTDSESPLPWPSLLLLWAATWLMKPAWHFFHRFGLLTDDQSAWVNWSFYDFIPACICLLMVTTGRRPRGHRLLTGLTLTIPLAYIAWMAVRGRLGQAGPDYAAMGCLLAVALWKWRPSNSFFIRLAPVGAISYGIYIFHSPIQWLLISLPWLPQGSATSFVLRSTLILALTFWVAWWTEKRFQLWLRKKMIPSSLPRST